jgi:hypothetical protein
MSHVPKELRIFLTTDGNICRFPSDVTGRWIITTKISEAGQLRLQFRGKLDQYKTHLFLLLNAAKHNG